MKNTITKASLLGACGLLFFFGGCEKMEKQTGDDASGQKAMAASVVTGTYGTYYITCVNGGKAIEVGGQESNGDKLKNSTGIQMWETGYNSTPFKWQKWNLENLGGNYYKIMNLCSGKVLDVPASSTSNGVQMQQFQWNGTNAQQWEVTEVGYGAYKIINRTNGLALTVENASTSNGARLVQQPYANTGSQWFVLNSIAADSYRDDEVTRFFQRTSGATAFDGLTSTLISSGSNAGKVFYTTNDTYWDNINANGSTNCLGNENQPIAERSSALIQPAKVNGAWNWSPSATTNIVTDQGRKAYKNSGTEWVWPSGCIEVNGHVYTYCDEGTGLSPQRYTVHDFYPNGTGYRDSVLSIPSLNNQINTTKIRFMHGMVKHTDNNVRYIYVYGENGNNMYVARFPESNPKDWRYWDGSTWATTPSTATAARIRGVAWGGFFVEKINGKFVVISIDLAFACDSYDRKMFSAVSTSPTSGFSQDKLVYQLPDYKQGHAPSTYAPATHAQFDNGKNELLVTYCINFYNKQDGKNGTCLPACSNPDGTMDPNDYRPKAVRIPYSLIGL